jgi:2-C-methyl-D-erythritol 4-phosphate cytidylyltransferase
VRVTSPPESDAPPGAAVVLLAAGEGRRVGAATNKVLLPLAGSAVFTWSLRTVLALPGVRRVVLVVRPQDRPGIDRALEEVGAEFPGAELWIVSGGESRHASEWNAVHALRRDIADGSVDVVAIHDTARPLARTELFERVIAAARRYGGALPVVERRSLVPRAGGKAPPTVVGVQTPQAFDAGRLWSAYASAEQDRFIGTDTASCLERYTDTAIHCVHGDARNLKITFPEDVALAERLLRGG